MRILLLLCLVGCIPTTPPRAPDVGCLLACQHLSALGCEEGGPTCVEYCDEYQVAGLDQHTGCLARVSACTETTACAIE